MRPADRSRDRHTHPDGADHPLPGEAYRRQARRLRGRLAAQPGRLHRSLRELARRADATRPADPDLDEPPKENGPIRAARPGVRPPAAPDVVRCRASRVVGDDERRFQSPLTGGAFAAALRTSPAVSDRFAEEVAQQVGDGLLTYSCRQDLLRTAGQLGIERFEAALIIAAVQHRHPPGSSGGKAPDRRGTGRSCEWAPWVAAAVVVQFAVLGSLWWIVRA